MSSRRVCLPRLPSHKTAPPPTSARSTRRRPRRCFPPKPPYSPYAGRNFPTRPYFGDTHTHTSFSMDAGAFGARLAPKDAYRFAKGEEVMASSGQRAKLSRPLDFLVVTDHSDGMGFFPQLIGGDPTLAGDAAGTEMVRRDQFRQGRAGRRRHHHQLRQGPDAEGLPDFRARPPTAAPGARPSRRRRRRTSPAASPPSSAMSGPRTPAETICIAMSSGATAAPRPRWSSRTRRCRRSAARIRATFGSGWRRPRKRPAPKSSRSRTTAI